MRWLFVFPLALTLFLLGPLFVIATGNVSVGADWRTASRNPVGLAPDPAVAREAVLQVYAARAFGWRAAFAVHTWIAVKPTDARNYTVYEVNGWRSYRGLPALYANDRPPDSEWFGSDPEILVELRGEGVDALIERITQAAATYPYADSYRAWPGPNSNTFVAYVARQMPELRLDLPPTAIGKDYLGVSSPLAAAPSGTGFQLSVFGLLGILVGIEEGIEINLLGLTMGIDPLDLAIKLPGVGRLSLIGETTVVAQPLSWPPTAS
ncbi:DUF3750 domain-containing protein [Rhodospirillaceae bacterium SYSU D60014]|uniref:DUF3750 domain-containing protein n=1 Tax=Virgifigura deserti TaxID=2268457 RepID=UPI000E66440F